MKPSIRITHCKNDIICHTDPLNNYRDASTEALHEACGFLLPWAVLGENLESMEQNLLDNYAYFAGWRDNDPKLSIDDIGKYCYKGDPDLHPYVTLMRGEEELHIYPYGIIAVRVGKEPYKTTRMD